MKQCETARPAGVVLDTWDGMKDTLCKSMTSYTSLDTELFLSLDFV